MGSVDNAAISGDIVQSIMAENPECRIIVDPVMGDNGRLYVPEAVAREIEQKLLPLADYITPNLWELSYLLKTELTSFEDVVRALSGYERNVLVTSVPSGRSIGGLLSQKGTTSYLSHDRFDKVPHGGGDVLAGLFTAHLVQGIPAKNSAQKSISAVFEVMKKADTDGADELPLVAMQDRFVSPDLIEFRKKPE